MTRTTIALLVGYAALATATVVGVETARRHAVRTLTSPELQADWDEWRAETKELSTSNRPEKRREAKALEPPLLIMLRDYYAAALVSSLVAVTLFYWFLAFLIRGSLQTPSPPGLDDERKEAA